MPPLQQTANYESCSDLVTRMSASKSVSFRSTVQAVWTLNLASYTKEEKERAFYSAAELQMVRSETRKSVTSFLSGHPPADFELRGIESFFPEASAKKVLRRNLAWDMVFQEQDRQWDEQVYDDDRIAEVYTSVTQSAAAEACNNALAYSLPGPGEEEDICAPQPTSLHNHRTEAGVNLLTASRMGPGLDRFQSVCPAA